MSLSPTPTVLVVLSALASVALFALNSGLNIGVTWAWAAAGQRMVYDLAADLFLHLQRLSLLFHSQRSVGDSLSRLTGDTYCVYALTEGTIVAPLQQVLTLVAITAIAWQLDAQLTLLALSVAPVMAASSLIFGRQLKRRSRLKREAKARLVAVVHQALTAVPMVQAFAAERQNTQRFEQAAAEAVRVNQRGALALSGFNLVNGLTTTVGTAIVLYAGGQRVLSGAMSVGTLLVFLVYLRSMHGATKGLLSIYGKLKTVEASIDRVLEVLETQEEVRDAPDARPLPVPRAAPRGHVRLDGIRFGYEPGRPVLHRVNLEAKPGETLALVGPTGAGKSTLVSLIPRFFDPWEGRVLVDGHDAREVLISSLRANVSIVLQEPFLLPLTIAENIAFGRPEATRREVVAAAEAANADEFIRRMPEGYETVIGERGATLSGGERQRLSIARALLKDTPILILDEPTSALDAQTEWLLMEAVKKLMRGRTTFIIAHRMSTIRRADRIVMLENGQIVEEGTHGELVALNGRYHRFCSPPSPTGSLEVVA
jgi:ATP-binding cassette subfamily B protein/subfamily B ATP-binding cassette protein MsbA